jgi:hypothetical protein
MRTIFTITMLLVLSSLLSAQEIALFADPADDFEIQWDDAAWEKLPPIKDSLKFDDIPVTGTHNPIVTVGISNWAADTSNVFPNVPKRAIWQWDIQMNPPVGYLFAIARINLRWRCRVTADGDYVGTSVWSDPQAAVLIAVWQVNVLIHLGALSP